MLKHQWNVGGDRDVNSQQHHPRPLSPSFSSFSPSTTPTQTPLTGNLWCARRELPSSRIEYLLTFQLAFMNLISIAFFPFTP